MRRFLERQVDGASLAAFRVAFGLLLLVLVGRFFAHGWIAKYFLEPTRFVPYWGFEWVRPWPGAGMYAHFAAMGVLATMIAAGAWYRFSVAAFGVLLAHAHLIDQTNYLNHYYLLICLCFLLAFLPLHRAFSVDARRRPELAVDTVPAWALWALRLQIGLVYFFGGLAKLRPDWLVDAQPLRIWLWASADLPVLGPLLQLPGMPHAMSWAGAIFDLTIVPLLLWSRTRVLAFALVAVFHLTTARLFHIGIFPSVMMASSTLYLPPDWPRRLLGRARAIEAPAREPLSRPALALLAIWFAFQLSMPLRHLLYPGDTLWTEQGFRFAWHVMLMEKDGTVDFHVTEPSTGRRWTVAPTRYLTRHQARMASTQPDVILHLAHVVARDFRERGVKDPEVRADAFASLNGRHRARLIDPRVDLARQKEGLAPMDWILPLPGTGDIAISSRESP